MKKKFAFHILALFLVGLLLLPTMQVVETKHYLAAKAPDVKVWMDKTEYDPDEEIACHVRNDEKRRTVYIKAQLLHTDTGKIVVSYDEPPEGTKLKPGEEMDLIWPHPSREFWDRWYRFRVYSSWDGFVDWLGLGITYWAYNPPGFKVSAK
jgi:hypothetical protein